MRLSVSRIFLVLAGAFLLVPLSGFVMPSEAQAQSSRIYFAGYLGTTRFNDQPYTETSSGSSGEIKMQNATSFAGALGLRLSRQMRIEGELTYRKNDMSRITFDSGADADLGGELGSLFGLVNLYYDVPVPFRWDLKPFVSAGIGFGRHEGEFSDSSSTVPLISESASGLAWQLGTGFRYRVNRDLAFSLGYRYLGSSDLEFDTLDFEYSSHEMRVGLEYDLPVAGTR